MDIDKPSEVFERDASVVRPFSNTEFRLPPWLFRQPDLSEVKSAQVIDLQTLINTLNYIHFTERGLLVHLYHHKFQENLLARAHPEPCTGDQLTCFWRDPMILRMDPGSYEFLHLVIEDGRSMIAVPVHLESARQDSFTITLPEKSYALGKRQARRYACDGVTVAFVQNDFLGRGDLLDFSPYGLRIRVRPGSALAFHLFDPEDPVMIHFLRDDSIFLTGLFRCLQQRGDPEEREVVVALEEDHVQRFKKRPIRNPRQKVVPAPGIAFEHPMFKKRVQMEVFDIGTSGFSVWEKADECLLIPGMILRDLTITYGGLLKLKCTVQVVYRHAEDEKRVRCGLAIVDMDLNSYSQLTHILTNALDSHSHISSDVDLDALWEFFFSTGFLYPKKYHLIQSNRESFKETYRKLYQGNPEVAKHFTYQKGGRIYGHISMVRAYQRTWMIHHHAARSMEGRRSGFMVLRQIMLYLNDMHRLPSTKMDYTMCYFRPENRFPDLVFGGFARALKNPRGCSMDLFSYFPCTDLPSRTELPGGWVLGRCSRSDLQALKDFYDQSSGGLMLDALCLDRKDSGDEPLEQIYTRLGFSRKMRVYSLAYRGELTAVLIVNRSERGLNLSELLNCVKVLVTNRTALPWDVLSAAVSHLCARYDMEGAPIILFPIEHMEKRDLPHEKNYQLWVLNVDFGDEYMEYMQRKFRITYS